MKYLPTSAPRVARMEDEQGRAYTRAINQHGEEVLSYRRKLLVYRREADTPYARAGY